MMNVVKSLRHCVRVLRRGASGKVPQNGQIAPMSVEQRRNYRYDDRFNWPTGNPGDGRDTKLGNTYSDELFDPRHDERHYKSYQRNDANNRMTKDVESRRRVPQHSLDHQRRQARIIQENKWRWQRRTEPKTAPGFRVSYEHPIYGASPQRRPGRQEQQPRRPGREQRLKEKQRQEKELRESRKDYDLPGYNRPLRSEAGDSTSSTDENQFASQAWLAKRKQENEQQYWHTWQTCPSERQDPETAEAEDIAEEISPGYESTHETRRGFVKPSRPYDGGVRRFQTHSLQLSEGRKHLKTKRSVVRRRPSGMEKQYLLARDFTTRIHRLSDESDNSVEEVNKSFKRPTSLLQSHVFRSSPTVYADEQKVEQLEDIGLPKQPPRMKLAWHGLPLPVYKRFESIKKAVARKQLDSSTKKRLQPPRFRMTVRSKGLARQRTPIDSFSNQLAVKTQFTPYSEYLGYGRLSVCDAWHNFANAHNLKPIC
ncbi:uncharacterized protein LOC132791195 [Drosophila nasuta]|uniref:uncharacterized protein LOC132791195 n=1 Tax=Drosophila nasuta TaxID=42062 RepID=UPI00295E91C6|nr:uncharacterized protein LOC132791195 [Drosophila nasuta]